MSRPARFRTAISCLALLLALVIVTGCPITKTIRYQGIVPLNENEEGESLPVKIIVYQFKDEETAKKFKTEPFDSIWTDDEGVLGDGLLMKNEIAEVVPGSAGEPPQELILKEEREEWDKNTRYVGVIALIRTDDGKPRREYVHVDEVENFVFALTEYHLEVRKR